jgi:hypothetical protein
MDEVLHEKYMPWLVVYLCSNGACSKCNIRCGGALKFMLLIRGSIYLAVLEKRHPSTSVWIPNFYLQDTSPDEHKFFWNAAFTDFVDPCVRSSEKAAACSYALYCSEICHSGPVHYLALNTARGGVHDHDDWPLHWRGKAVDASTTGASF